MKIFKQVADINKLLFTHKKNGKNIGFVPTMGALHPGHISLLEASTKRCDISACSIFVNPTQFNDAADFENYPTTIENDIDVLEKAGCDILFLPPVSEIYPNGTTDKALYELGYLETVLEGRYRPGHFQGVCQVVYKLLQIIPATQLYLGQKDYQQCMVIKKMIDLTNLDTSIIICPTLREKDGLAMSSRNMRLAPDTRKIAAVIYETLCMIKNEIVPGDITALQQTAFTKLTAAGLKPDYIEIAGAANLSLIKEWDGKTKLVALVAAFAGDVRLIDNLLLQ
mgnify:FL=1